MVYISHKGSGALLVRLYKDAGAPSLECSLAKFWKALKLLSLGRFTWFKKLALLIQTLRFSWNQHWKDLGHLNSLKFAQTLPLPRFAAVGPGNAPKVPIPERTIYWVKVRFWAYPWHITIVFFGYRHYDYRKCPTSLRCYLWSYTQPYVCTAFVVSLLFFSLFRFQICLCILKNGYMCVSVHWHSR